MKHLYWLVLTTLLGACGPAVNKDPVVADSELLKYAQKFQQEIGVSTAGISMVFDDLDRGTVGVCSIGPMGKKITIDLRFWNQIDQFTREELMYHELGHCAMHLGHDEDLRSDGCPVSVMFPYVFSYCYERDSLRYKNDLIARVGSNTLALHAIHNFSCNEKNLH